MVTDWQGNDGLTLNPEEHEILPHPGGWVSSLNREFSREDLMLYRHKVHGTFVLGVWWDKSKGIICEFFALKDHPDRLRTSLKESGDLGAGSFDTLPHKSWIHRNFIEPAQKRKEEIFREMAEYERKERETNLQEEQEIMEIGNHLARGKKGKRRHWADHPYVKDLQQGQLPPMEM